VAAAAIGGPGFGPYPNVMSIIGAANCPGHVLCDNKAPEYKIFKSSNTLILKDMGLDHIDDLARTKYIVKIVLLSRYYITQLCLFVA
jgi:hypothetical protein